MSTNHPSALDWLLFVGSPFLPPIYQENVDNVVRYVNEGGNTIITSITAEIARIGNRQNERHIQEIMNLKFQYEIDTINLSHYFYGYATPLQLLLCLEIMKTKPLNEAIKHILNPSPEPILIELNSYKESLIIPAAEIYFGVQEQTPANVVFPIYGLCRQTPFVLDSYFLLGLEASQRKFWELYNYIEILPPAPQAPLS